MQSTLYTVQPDFNMHSALGHATGQVLTDAVIYQSNIVQAKAAAGKVANIYLLA